MLSSARSQERNLLLLGRYVAQRFMASAAATSPPPLCTPLTVSDMKLDHRVVLSSMSRFRNDKGTGVPGNLVAEYFEQRSTPGGLVVGEVLSVSESAKPAKMVLMRVSGLYTKEQVAGWKMVTDRVHAKGSKMYGQLFHPGRMAHSSMLPGNVKPLGASPFRIRFMKTTLDNGKLADYELPREATEADLQTVIADHASAAKIAVTEAGFDGVEIHCGNGYLIQQFMCKTTNYRTDNYGGSVENRCRLLLQVVDAVITEIGAGKVAVKLQPGLTLCDLVESEPDVIEALQYLGPELSKRNLSYTCLSSMNGFPFYQFVGRDRPNISFDIHKFFRALYKGPLMINGGLTIEEGNAYVADGTADAVQYGIHFIANPNLPELVAKGVKTQALTAGGLDMGLWFSADESKDAVGYTDYPPNAAEASA